jgi:lysophospholipase L1-like esterase
MQKRILVFSIAANFLFIILFVLLIRHEHGFSFITYTLGFHSTFGVPTINPVNRDSHAKQRESMFEILPKDSSEIIFIGNSIARGCEWNELFKNLKIKNRGIGGNKTYDVLMRISNTLESKPKKIFILIGINDLSEDLPIDSIFKNYNQIMEKIKNESPTTEVYIQSILPINDKYYGGFATNEKIKLLNLRLQSLADDKNLKYINLYSHFLDSEGNLSEMYSNDGIHLLGRGYQLWKSIIEKDVNDNIDHL